MKKFSVLLVAILALMMLFVSCENEPKERVATMKDGEIVEALYSSAIRLAFPEPGELKGENVEILENSATFTGAECEHYNKKKVILTGTFSWKYDEKGSYDVLNLGTGTKYNGEDHTLQFELFYEKGAKEPVVNKLVLDGVALKEFLFY